MFPVNATAKSEIGRTGLRNTLFYQTTGKSSAVTAHTGNNMLEYIKMLVNAGSIMKSWMCPELRKLAWGAVTEGFMA